MVEGRGEKGEWRGVKGGMREKENGNWTVRKGIRN